MRFGGHFVQGHVDTTASIVSITPDGNALTFRFAPTDATVLKYVVEKGYITVDGASLTVVAVSADWFEVMLVAYTQDAIVTARKTPGELVNVEVDMTGKYIEVCGYHPLDELRFMQVLMTLMMLVRNK